MAKTTLLTIFIFVLLISIAFMFIFNLYTDIEIPKSKHYDILKKKGNCLTKEENDIVFKIENLEVELEKIEIDLINNKEFLERNPQI